jgi:peroxiredoxin Q/BCP
MQTAKRLFSERDWSMSTPAPLSAGHPAPAFSLPATDGRTISLDQYRGKQAVVLYFYPKDDTPGCTKEACAFRDLGDEFAKAGAAILGVSTDSVESHEQFRGKYGLNFPLLADTDAQVATAYGAYGPKTSFGKETVGMRRATFVIDANGTIRKVYPNVKVDQHADEVLAFLRTL